MTHAEICPVCNGKGQIQIDKSKSAINMFNITCHGCNGQGWITLSDEIIIKDI